MKLFKKIVDERQELEMMRIERRAFYLFFFGLVIAMIIQVFVLNFDFTHVVGELIVLIIVGVWSLISFIRRGIWDYYTKPGIKSYIIYSLIAAFISSILLPIVRYFRNGASLADCLLIFVINFGVMFVILFVLYMVLGHITKARQNKLQQEYEDEK